MFLRNWLASLFDIIIQFANVHHLLIMISFANQHPGNPELLSDQAFEEVCVETLGLEREDIIDDECMGVLGVDASDVKCVLEELSTHFHRELEVRADFLAWVMGKTWGDFKKEVRQMLASSTNQ